MTYLTQWGEFYTSGYQCRHCHQCCLLFLPSDAPFWMRQAYKKAYEGLLMMATCKKGREEEYKHTGYNFDYLQSYLAHQPKKFQDMTKTCIVELPEELKSKSIWDIKINAQGMIEDLNKIGEEQ